MRNAVDTSILIAALVSWHEHHDVARDAISHAIEGDGLVVPADVLIEAYAVLTRLPPPHRISPKTAHELLSRSFKSRTRVVTLRARDVWPLLGRLSDEQIAGGRTYDARILAAAERAGATRLLTFDARDFERLGPCDVEIVVPD